RPGGSAARVANDTFVNTVPQAFTAAALIVGVAAVATAITPRRYRHDDRRLGKRNPPVVTPPTRIRARPRLPDRRLAGGTAAWRAQAGDRRHGLRPGTARAHGGRGGRRAEFA